MPEPPEPPESPAVAAAVADLRGRYDASAIVFYGSCLRDRTSEGLLDFYVLVESAEGAWLPPDVHHHNCGPYRAKVAVMRVDDFLAGLGPGWFTSSLSARFAQPAAIVFARDDALRARLQAGFVTAADTCMARILPLMPPRFTAGDLWRRAFRESFAAELRPESAARIDSLVDADPAFYDAQARRLLGDPRNGVFHHDALAGSRLRATLAWRARRIAGKALNALRLIKAAFTFEGGLDYAAWKIARHSGVVIAITDADRKKPLRAGLRLFAQTLRRGGLG